MKHIQSNVTIQLACIMHLCDAGVYSDISKDIILLTCYLSVNRIGIGFV